MGNNESYIDKCSTLERIALERILDAENKIYIGIKPHIGMDEYNYSLQVIRFGDYREKSYRLVKFTENKDKLKYEFENDIVMELIKQENNILLDIKKQNLFIKKEMDPIIRKHYKKLDFVSYELDKIKDFIHN